jgi:hypothetical protein
VLAFGRSAWATYSAQITQVVDKVVVAPPWELHAFIAADEHANGRVRTSA